MSGLLLLTSWGGLQVQRPSVQPVIVQDLFIFRNLARLANSFARRRLGTDAALIVDEFAEKLLEELDYNQEARNIEVRARLPLYSSCMLLSNRPVEVALMQPSSWSSLPGSCWRSWTTTRRPEQGRQGTAQETKQICAAEYACFPAVAP